MTLETGWSAAGHFIRRFQPFLPATEQRSIGFRRWATFGIVTALAVMTAGILSAQVQVNTPQNEVSATTPAKPDSLQVPADVPPVQAETPAVAAVNQVQPPKEKDPFDRGFGEMEIPGRVIDVDGNPVAKAQIFWRNWGVRAPVAKTQSDEEGHFIIKTFRRKPADGGNQRIDPDELKKNLMLKPSVIATAPGYGFGTAIGGEGLTIRLVPDEPIVGRISDDNGQPIQGARVRIRDVLWPRRDDDPIVELEHRQGDRPTVPIPDGEGLDPWIAAIRQAANMNDFFVARQYLVGLIQSSMLGNRPSVYAPLVPPVVTDNDGKFVLRGVGRERVAEVYVDGVPNRASVLILIANRLLDPPIVVAAETASVKKFISNPGRDLTVFGREVELTLPAGRTIEGVVTDRESGRPLSRVRVIGPTLTRIEYPGYDRFFATTDHQGHYRIENFPLMNAADFEVKVAEDADDVPIKKNLDEDDVAYFSREVSVNVVPGTESIQVDVPLSRGIWITGKVVDDVTGQGLSGATIEYHVFNDNPHLKKELERNSPPEFAGYASVREDGSFRLRALPGRGIVTASGGSDYLQGIGTDAIKGLKKDEYRESLYHAGGFSPYIRSTTIEVNIDDDVSVYECEVRLFKGKTRIVTVVDPAGERLTDLEASGLKNQVENPISKIVGNVIEIANLYPGERREVVARSVSRKLMGMATVTDQGDDLVKLELKPWASVTGRLVDDAGQPRSRGLRIRLDDGKLPIHTFNGLGYNKPEFLIDAEGKFEIIGMVPGAKYRLQVVEGGFLILGNATGIFILKPGEEKQLGDVKVIKRAKAE